MLFVSGEVDVFDADLECETASNRALEDTHNIIVSNLSCNLSINTDTTGSSTMIDALGQYNL